MLLHIEMGWKLMKLVLTQENGAGKLEGKEHFNRYRKSVTIGEVTNLTHASYDLFI